MALLPFLTHFLRPIFLSCLLAARSKPSGRPEQRKQPRFRGGGGGGGANWASWKADEVRWEIFTVLKHSAVTIILNEPVYMTVYCSSLALLAALSYVSRRSYLAQAVHWPRPLLDPWLTSPDQSVVDRLREFSEPGGQKTKQMSLQSRKEKHTVGCSSLHSQIKPVSKSDWNQLHWT